MHAAYTPPASAGPPLRGCCWGPPPAARRGRSYSPSWARLWNEHQSEGQHYCDDPLPKSRNRAEVQWRQAATQGLQCLLLNAPESGQVSPSFFMVAGLAPAARALLRISSRSCRFLLLTSFASASSADICGVRCTALSHCKVYRSVTAAFPPQYYDTVTGQMAVTCSISRLPSCLPLSPRQAGSLCLSLGDGPQSWRGPLRCRCCLPSPHCHLAQVTWLFAAALSHSACSSSSRNII